MNLTKSLKEAFKFGDKQLRVVGTIEEPWFCGKDVAEILEYKKSRNAIQVHVKNKYKIKLKDLYEKFNALEWGALNRYEKHMIYIKEAGLYSLIMKSNMKDAEKFQDWVVEEVLPSIRKNGYYVDPNINNQKIQQLQQELKEKDDQLNRLHNIQKELLSYKKRVVKEETVYIVSTANYARQGIFKIGRTKTKMQFRSSSHNTTHVQG